MIGVLGAGIMGCCLALALAKRGHQVTLIDRASMPMTGASLHNEGKLHLGFVYAKDPLKETHKQMARGSLSFSRIIEQLTGRRPDTMLPSSPFHYFVPVDSQLSLDAIHQHFFDVEDALHEHTRLTGDQYLGRQIEQYFEVNSAETHRRLFSPEKTLGSFKTSEVSVSPVAVANVLKLAVAAQTNIQFIGNSRIDSVEKRSGGEIRVVTNKFTEDYACVVNCLWDDKLRIDNTAGIFQNEPWILRYKATITIPSEDAYPNIPSATGILGKYGDVVRHSDGMIYISWYPLCKLAEGVNVHGDALRDEIHSSPIIRSIRNFISNFPSVSKVITSHAHQGFIQKNILEMSAFIPEMRILLGMAKHGHVAGGVILAKGQTDIDDPESRLHQRSKIGPVAYENYITVDTGKYCMAPLFALETAEMVEKVI